MRILKTAQGKQSERKENDEAARHGSTNVHAAAIVSYLARAEEGREIGWKWPGAGGEKIKHIRAQGECPGTDCRRRTWQAAKSHGEPQAGVDPWISEWGNPAGVMPRHHGLNKIGS